MKRSYSPKRLCVTAIFVAVGLVLQLAESTLTFLAVPGAKIGLANAVTLVNLFILGGSNAFVTAALRAFMGALMSGGAASAVYAVSGAVVSAAVMLAAKRLLYPRLGVVGISILGAVAHNMTQLTVAAFMAKSLYVYSYMSAILIFALCGGIATGYAAVLVLDRASAQRKYI